MADKKNNRNLSKLFSTLNRTNQNINKELFENKDVDKNIEDLDRIENIISQITKEHKKYTGGNLIEFLTKIELNKNDINNDGIKSKLSGENIEKILGKGSIAEFIMDEQDRISRYEDYNLIDAYIPQISKCLDVLADCILSPDDYSKQSLNFLYDNSTNKDENEYVIKNIKNLDKKYKINKKVRSIIRESLKLGDKFIAVLKLSDEFNKFLLKENDDIFINRDDNIEEFVLTESHLDFSEVNQLINEDISNKKEKDSLSKNTRKSIVDAINNNIKFFNDPTDLLSDAKKSKIKKQQNNDEIKINGSVIKFMDAKKTIKLVVDNLILGYLYLEENNSEGSCGKNNNFFSNNDYFNSRYDLNEKKNSLNAKQRAISNIFIQGISKKIDKKFIEDNKEFRDYIYTLVRNDYITEKKINITFLEPDQVVDICLESNDTYGVSKIAKSLFFAKLYLATLITTLMQKISRGRDKRAVYVEAGIDSDYEGAIQQVVKDIKSKEITSDTLSNITTIFNNVGSFEDYFIPVINGEKPLEIDTISGMDVDINSDFLDYLKKSIIDGTPVPYNYIDATMDVDFARTLTMQNTIFLRSIISLQNEFSEAFTKLIQILYKNEYPEDFMNDKNKENIDKIIVDIDKIKVLFSEPIYLSLNNINDQISNASSTLDFITNIYFGDGGMSDDNIEEKKHKFKKEVIKDYLPNINWDKIDNIYNNIEIETVESSIKTTNSSNMDDNDSDSDYDF